MKVNKPLNNIHVQEHTSVNVLLQILKVQVVIMGKGMVWFGGFYGISTFVGYLTPNPFLCK